MDILQAWGIGLIVAIQAALSPALDGPLRLISFTGAPTFFTLLIPLLYWCVDTGLGARFLLLLVGGDALSGVLKLALHTPRPYWLSPNVKALDLGVGYGLPSGHAQSSTTAWLLLAHAIRRGWAWAAALVLILLVSFSRLALGAHFPHDVLAGWLVGLALVALCWRYEPEVRARLKRLAAGGRLLAALILPAAVLLLWGGVAAGRRGAAMPPEWARQAAQAAALQGEPAIDPDSGESLVTEAGVLLGAGLGLALLHGRLRFAAGGPLGKRAARFVLGIVVLLAIQLGLGAAFPEEPLALGYALRFVRYGLMGIWLTGGAPWAFARLGLAEAAD